MAVLSLIIPVYNAGKYLEKCLNSLLNQTFRDIEIVCVNDGSTDTSPEILKEYAKKDQRVVVISQKNKGCVQARRKAYENSSGDYIAMVDADDWLEPDTYEKVIGLMKRHGSDVCFFNFYENTDVGQVPFLGYKEEQMIEGTQQIERLVHACLRGKENPVLPGRPEGGAMGQGISKRSI